ncbi:dihydrofolate reductase family protein [Gorillibacterium timonense]|uniref:dihydrofolate reductase family protein n=1 Tax=Gorillibacterium timonense TaxID=1689269 RepID=UPI00071E0FF6|nr:RibD family protein [Gorillibacterium timonense]
MSRPYTVCHMMSSLDGRITGPFMETEAAVAAGEEYERINGGYHPQAWLCGRVTTDENFTFYKKPELDDNAPAVPEGDHVAVKNAKMYYVSVDASGKIGWSSNTLHYADRPAAHIIEVLTERASNAYRVFLRKLGISYIIAGKDELDPAWAVEKLKELFDIQTLMVSGGGVINWSFLQAGLIDELSLVLTPVVDGETNTVTLFEKTDYLPLKVPTAFSLKSVEKLKGDGVWLCFITKP